MDNSGKTQLSLFDNLELKIKQKKTSPYMSAVMGVLRAHDGKFIKSKQICWIVKMQYGNTMMTLDVRNAVHDLRNANHVIIANTNGYKYLSREMLCVAENYKEAIEYTQARQAEILSELNQMKNLQKFIANNWMGFLKGNKS